MNACIKFARKTIFLLLPILNVPKSYLIVFLLSPLGFCFFRNGNAKLPYVIAMQYIISSELCRNAFGALLACIKHENKVIFNLFFVSVVCINLVFFDCSKLFNHLDIRSFSIS